MPKFILLLLFFLPASPQEEPKPVLSNDPMTQEQIAVYRALLVDYMKEEKNSALNISNVTDPFGAGPEYSQGCPRDIRAQSTPASHPVIHRLDPAVALNPRMLLVDRDQQMKLIKKNDPHNRLVSAVENNQPMNEIAVDKSVETAFSTGLFTFSEILFNKKHTRAAVQYSFYCGGLCAHGNIVVLKKAQGNWKVSKVCGGWIS